MDGINYMFLWLKDKDCFYRDVNPHLFVLKQENNNAYSKENIRKRDELVEGFESDEKVIGCWKVIDFVRQVESFNPDIYNASFEKKYLFFKMVDLRENGNCYLQYGTELLKSPEVNWSKGVIQEIKPSLCQHYVRKIIDGTEYLFVEFKSGDYFYNHQKPWWYVFVRTMDDVDFERKQ